MERARPGADAPAARLTTPAPPGSPPGVPPAGTTTPARESLRDVRLRLQNQVMRALGSGLNLSDPVDVRRQVEAIIARIVTQEGFALTRAERSRLLEQITNEIIGLGPLEPLLKDETITEVMVNGPRQIYIERAGRLERADVSFANDEHVMRIIDRIIAPIGRRIDETSPMVDARLEDGSRVNAIIPPLSLVGPVITIRKFAATPFTVEDLVRFGTATPEMFDFLKACVEARLNMFVSGGTGSGKTTTLNVLSSFIPDDERIITIEDAAELQLRQRHVITLEARPPNIEGRGAIPIRELVRNSLHMRPDRIIVGECRSGEALDMLQAMNTGQDGSLSTGHANTPRDMLLRLETMVLMTGYELPLRAIREQIAASVDMIVHTARLKDGSRKIMTITEVLGMDGAEIITQDIFDFDQTGMQDGRVLGELKPTGVRPTFATKIKDRGVEVSADIYGPLLAATQDADAEAAAAVSGPVAGYSEPVRAGGMVYLSGMGPVDPRTGRVVGMALQEQAHQCLTNLKARLEQAGTTLDKVVWVTWVLRDADDIDTVLEEWARWLSEGSPARQVSALPVIQRNGRFRVSVAVIAEA